MYIKYNKNQWYWLFSSNNGFKKYWVQIFLVPIDYIWFHWMGVMLDIWQESMISLTGMEIERMACYE